MVVRKRNEDLTIRELVIYRQERNNKGENNLESRSLPTVINTMTYIS